jgi:hypothetical protein
MKQCLYALSFLFLLSSTACKKTDATTDTIPVVATWKLDKVIPSKLTGVYANLNNQSFDALQYFAFESIISIKSDKTFTDKEVDNGITTNYSGTWTYSGNTLTLKYTDNSIEILTYDDVNKKLTYNDVNTTLTFTHPTTKREEDVVCDAQYQYIKQ